MEPWKNYIGDGNGCMFFFTQSFIDNGLINAEYKASLEAVLGTGGITKQTVAERYKIFENANTSDAKKKFYSIIKKEVFKLDVGEYFFGLRIFYNPALSESEAMDFVSNDDLNGLINHPSTLEMTVANGSDFIDFLL